MIDGRNIFDQPVKTDLRIKNFKFKFQNSKNTRKIATG